MAYKQVAQKSYARAFQMGPMRVKQPLPTKELEQISPFLLLHHVGPTLYEAGKERMRLSPHPHRGFEPVTFLFSGKLHHKDSMGNEGFLESGDVQWMTAGSGILHSEGPSEQFFQEGGTLELIQLWVNLPREHKMTQPRYQDIKKQAIPTFEENGFTFSLVAGKYRESTGPAATFTPITAMVLHFEAGAKTALSLPASWNTLLYVLEGSIHSQNKQIDHRHMAVFDKEGEAIELVAPTKGRALLLGGEPIQEPLASYGPFVMNYPGEIKQAILDYETGKMGRLDS